MPWARKETRLWRSLNFSSSSCPVRVEAKGMELKGDAMSLARLLER